MTDLLARTALLSWIAVTWLLGGRLLIPRKLRQQDGLLVAASSLGLAAGTTAVVLTAVAAVGALHRWVLWTVQIAWTCAAVFGRKEALAFAIQALPIRGARRDLWQALAGGGIVLAALLALVGTLAPPTSMDATVYHLRIPQEFLRYGRIVLLSDDVHSFQPLNVEMLFALGIGLRDDVLAALIHFLLAIGAALAAGSWARRLGAGSTLVAIAVFALSPLVIWEASSSFIDLGLALFASVGLLWASRPDLGRSATCLAAVFAGFAVGTKFTGCAAAALIGLMALLVVLPDIKRGMRRFVAVGCGAVVIGSPWYIRNAVFTGNPVYPIANKLFGVPDSRVGLSNWKYGYGGDLLHLLTSPFDLIWRGDVFDLGWSVGPAYLALLPIALLPCSRQPLHRSLGIVLVVFWLFWFYSSPQTRLLLPFLPVAAGAAALGFERMSLGDRWSKLAARFVVGLSTLIGLAAAGVVAAGSWRVVAGIETRENFLRRMAQDYEAFELVNARLPAEAHVAILDVPNVYYMGREVTVVGAEEVPVLQERGFSHLVTLRDCGEKEAEYGRTLWRGRYVSPGSRFQGARAAAERCVAIFAVEK